MKVENPLAFSFILQDDLYLLNKDKTANESKVSPITEEASRPVTETVRVSFNYLGGNKKRFLVIVHYPETEFMAEGHLTALENTLKRLNFTFDDTAIFNRANYRDVSFEQLADFFIPQKLLILGSEALPPGIEALSMNKPHRLNNYPALFTFSFDEMMDNNENKKAFWEQMKQL